MVVELLSAASKNLTDVSVSASQISALIEHTPAMSVGASTEVQQMKDPDTASSVSDGRVTNLSTNRITSALSTRPAANSKTLAELRAERAKTPVDVLVASQDLRRL